MPKYSKQELISLLGKPKNTIWAWCAPSKRTLIVGEDGLIDTALDKNRLFIEQKILEKGSSPQKQTIKPRPGRKTAKVKIDDGEKEKKISKPKPVDVEAEARIKAANDFEQEKRDLTLEKLREEVRIKRAEAESKEGEFIDASKAVAGVKQWSIEKDKYLLQQLDKHIKFICDREGVPADRSAKYKKEIVIIVNEASQIATDKLKTRFK